MYLQWTFQRSHHQSLKHHNFVSNHRLLLRNSDILKCFLKKIIFKKEIKYLKQRITYFFCKVVEENFDEFYERNTSNIFLKNKFT